MVRKAGETVRTSGELSMHERPKILRRTLIWMVAAAFALTGAYFFEHTSSSGVMIDALTLAKSDGTCQGGTKPDCEPCTDDHGKVHDCHKPCVKSDGTTKPDCQPCGTDPHSGQTKECHKPCVEGNGNTKKDCIPCESKGKPKECKPCTTDAKGNTH